MKQGRVYEVVATIRVNYWLEDDSVYNDDSLDQRVLKVIANDILDGWITESDGLDSMGFVPIDEFAITDYGDREFDIHKEDSRS